ncbi:AAA family ATPase [Sinomonas albida]|uniref:AAA family ATPase n=1 Tax=Sinomonas albida TaxID=369942 RepID=UPI003018FB3A
MSPLHFVVAERTTWPRPTAGLFTLLVDSWDDFHFKTSYMLHYGLGETSAEIGAVKIALRGMTERGPHTQLPASFSQLDAQLFSLGQDREYYEKLLALPNGIGLEALRALRDVAEDEALFEQVRSEEVFTTSLLRSVPLQTVTNQFRRIIRGDAPLTPYRFTYTQPISDSNAPPLQLQFGVHPEVMPPTNVHVLIGANGVGKSSLLRDFLAAGSGSTTAVGSFKDELTARFAPSSEIPFANVVHIAYSAFDREENEPLESSDGVRIHRVGLSKSADESLEDQFFASLKICARGSRKARWLDAVSTLVSADGVLNDAGPRNLINRIGDANESTVRGAFSRMSSGHRIALLTVTRSVELIEERSLVLLDEPETHLHPPLLSALTRAISDLVIARNGVAIMATHSPVVLQEVPASCVWTLRRSGNDLRAFRPSEETFGESVSRLTSSVFFLDVNQTGYNKVLRDLLREHSGSAERVMDALSGQLGSEGRFVLSSLENQQGDNHV